MKINHNITLNFNLSIYYWYPMKIFLPYQNIIRFYYITQIKRNYKINYKIVFHY
jgi:hypothetical protein